MFSANKIEKLQPMVLFWLGLLTGAIIVGLVFLYATYQAQYIQDLIFQGGGTQFIQSSGA